jgi:hypothetical protein
MFGYRGNMSPSGENTKSRKKRPETTGELIGVRLQADLLQTLDDWRAKQRPIPTRPEAIRELISIKLCEHSGI